MSIARIETAPSVLPQELLNSALQLQSTRRLEVIHSVPDAITDKPISFDLHSIPLLVGVSQSLPIHRPPKYSKFWSNYNKYNQSYHSNAGEGKSSLECNLELRLDDQNQELYALKALETFQKPPVTEAMQMLAAQVLADIKKPKVHYDAHGKGTPQSVRLGSIALLETPEGYSETVVVSPHTFFQAKSCLHGIQEKHKSADYFTKFEPETVEKFNIIPVREDKLEFEAFVQTVAATALLAGMTSAKLLETTITKHVNVDALDKLPILTLV